MAAEEFDDGPTFIERSLSAPTMSVYDSFQDFLPTNLPSRLDSKYNPQPSSGTSAHHFHVGSSTDNNNETSYLAALTDLDILDDSHVAQIKSLVIDPKAKSFDFIPVRDSPLFFISSLSLLPSSFTL
jgi:hypothetical protein